MPLQEARIAGLLPDSFYDHYCPSPGNYGFSNFLALLLYSVGIIHYNYILYINGETRSKTKIY